MGNSLNRKLQRREVALFTNNEIIGFEEIFRKRLLSLLKKEFLDGEGNDYFKNRPDKTTQLFADKTLGFRNFTAIVKSSNAKLYFLKRDDLENFLRYMPNNLVKDEVLKRTKLLEGQVNTLIKVTEKEHQNRQRMMLAKKLITRNLKYNAETLPTTEREELQQDVRKSMEIDKKIAAAAAGDVGNLSPSMLNNSLANFSIKQRSK